MIEKDGLEVRTSKLNGKGIFTKRQFRNKEIIFKVEGKIFTKEEIYKTSGKFTDNTFRFAKDFFISPEGELGDFLNHSCDPNSGVIKIQDGLFVVAIKDIDVNEEILMDYSTILTNDDTYELDCNCGSKECRSKVRRYTSLPQKIKEKYIQLGIVPEYILNQ